MRIAYLASRYPDISHTFIMREVLALRERGVTIETISVRPPEPHELLSDEDRAGAASTFYVLPISALRLLRVHLSALAAGAGAYFRALSAAFSLAPPGLRATLWQLFYFAEAIVVWGRCRELGIRHIHVHFANVSADVALLATRVGNEISPGAWSWSFTMHGPTEFYDIHEHRLGPKTEDAVFVACISDFARSQLMGLIAPGEWGKLAVVHCGIDLHRFARETERADGELDVVEILSVGRLVAVKGQAILIEAVAQLAGAGMPVHLTLVGDGPERRELERLARDIGVEGCVTFAGSVGQDEIRAYFAAADLFCSASFAEGVPVVLMEAMAMRVPVVATRIMGVGELVEDGVSGRLVPPGRVDALAAVLRELIESPELRYRLAERGRDKIEAEFDIRQAATLLSELFARTLTDARPPSGVLDERAADGQVGPAPRGSAVGER
jgi:glycosyltransferase involved in cell wall biosynthesis